MSQRRPCPTGKIRYRDELGAKIALAGGAGERGSVRVYPCPQCRGWHTTSQDRRAA